MALFNASIRRTPAPVAHVALLPIHKIGGYLEKRRSRKALAGLTVDQLRDIGLSQSQADAEFAKSWFWI
ncbi:DUF1127 domain-containing protein [Phyllobacterium sp. SB3]|uniref:DUF1127 domain-containing protein n=1 Tax=Phyllobacterium sp. SB3 TaxID=3156073 RepID=UPI0032AFB1F4